ncbi:sensor histidine kinase [Dyadobacter pollutisoli]|uniref:Oxygen sensor histidine kinase NreB n=1 Tax=Dyadobacter pollutisoli TaxID=2910158 RepID=A0A9E8SKG5_9BACT|nr:7TM-DISM domain-containing protein [Dyadobacter pollutisoli]WAC12450.1 ATP-binding protein [Dyadobacter pollutisoli]
MTRFILACALLLVSIDYSYSRAIRWNPRKTYINIGNRLAILEDKSNLLKIDQVSSAEFDNKFTPSQQNTLHFGLNKSAFWLKFEFYNNSSEKLYLQLEHAFIPTADLYVRDSKGSWTVIKSGYKVLIGNKPISDHWQSFPLLSGKHEYFIRLIPYVHPINVKIWNSKSYLITSNKEKLYYGIYLGLLFFVFAIHLFLFISLKHNYYLAYCLLIVSYILTSTSVLEGYFIYAFPFADMMYWYKIVPAIDMPIMLVYCLLFLEVKKYRSNLFYFTVMVCVILLLYLPILHFLPDLVIFVANWVMALLVFILAIYIGVSVGKSGNNLGYYYSVTYVFWLILVAMEEINIQFGTPEHLFDITYVSIAILVESFFLSILLAKRLQWDKEQNDQIRFELQKDLIRIQDRFDNEMLQAQLEIQEQTFNNISQEIHDNIGQSLGIVSINLYSLDNIVNENDEQRISESINLVSNVMNELRDIAKSLNSDYLRKIGLLGALEQQASILRKTGIFEVQILSNDQIILSDSNKELLIFRVLQELLSNIVKHAKATNIVVNVDYQHTHLSITVQDNGNGFDVEQIFKSKSSGLGLTNIKNRVNMIDGSFSIKSSPASGTVATIKIPV